MPVWGKAEFDRFYVSSVERWGHPAERPSIKLNYHWFPIIRYQTENYAPMLATVLSLVQGDGLILVGCGFNGTGAGLTALGYRVIGTDTSTYISSQRTQTEEAEIRAACTAAGVNPDTDLIIGPPGNVMVNPLDLLMEGGRAAPALRGKGTILTEEMRTRGSRNSVLAAFQAQFPGVTPRYIVTEEVLNSITDNEAGLVCSYCQSGSSEWGSTVVHMLSPLQTGPLQDADLNWKTYSGWRSFLNGLGYTAHRILPTVTAANQGMTFPVGNAAGVVTAYSGLI